MRALLDTHSFLWFIAGDLRLSEDARRIVADLENELLVSVASLWEIAIKPNLGVDTAPRISSTVMYTPR